MSQKADALPEQASRLIGQSFTHKVNCFCISKIFFDAEEIPQMLTADEMLEFVSSNFLQIENPISPTLTLIWSRSSHEIPLGKINVAELSQRSVGFPFGLILEHSFVQLQGNKASSASNHSNLENEIVFQKADPTLKSSVELISFSEAIAPYKHLNGFEITRHILKS